MDVGQRVAVVTGGASGIGRSLCLAFAEHDAAAVVVADVDGQGALGDQARAGRARRMAVHHLRGERGIAVSCLCPQAVSTNLLATSNRQVSAGTPPEPSSRSGAPQAAVDGVLTPEQVAACVLDSVADERFLILPHPEVATYERRRADDRERWLRGMRRLQARLSGGR